MSLSYSQPASFVYITCPGPRGPFPSEDFAETLSSQFGGKEPSLYIRQTYVVILGFSLLGQMTFLESQFFLYEM